MRVAITPSPGRSVVAQFVFENVWLWRLLTATTCGVLEVSVM